VSGDTGARFEFASLTNGDHLGLAGAALGEESLDGAEHVFLESRGAAEPRSAAAGQRCPRRVEAALTCRT
jgi:hypothetical protein